MKILNEKFGIQDLDRISRLVFEQINKNKSDKGATLVTFSGDLGAGKTTLIKELGKSFGIKEPMISPTFVIMKRYSLSNSDFKSLFHLDAYRLSKNEDLKRLGFKDILNSKDTVILLEWPEMVTGAFDDFGKSLNVDLKHIDENTREINLMEMVY